MAYTKQNFEDGQVLNAEHLNNMEDGIEDVSKIVVTEGSPDTLTWDGNTEGLVCCAEMDAYKISDATPTIDDFANGASYSMGGEVDQCTQDEIISIVCDGVISIGGMMIIPPEIAGADWNGMLFPEPGIYAIPGMFEYITIPGYTGFVTEKIDTKYLPEHLQFGDKVVVSEIIPETEFVGVDEDGMYTAYFDASLFSGDEDVLVITFDGTDYTCTVDLGFGFPCYGNVGLIGGDDTGEPFLLAVIVEYGQALIVFCDDEPHLVSIAAQKTVIRKIDEKYLPENNWEDLAGKPFGEIHGDTLVWDGSFVGHEVVGAFVHVSSATPSMSDLAGGVTFNVDNVSLPMDAAPVSDGVSALILGGSMAACVVARDGAVFSGDTFPLAGVYLLGGVGACSITVNGYKGFTCTKQIDEAYLPAITEDKLPYEYLKKEDYATPNWNQNDPAKPGYIRNKPKVVGHEVGTTIRDGVRYFSVYDSTTNNYRPMTAAEFDAVLDQYGFRNLYIFTGTPLLSRMSYHDAGEYYYGVVYSSVNLKNGAMEPVLEMIYTTKSPE